MKGQPVQPPILEGRGQAVFSQLPGAISMEGHRTRLHQVAQVFIPE
jgi:hypothetical protein